MSTPPTPPPTSPQERRPAALLGHPVVVVALIVLIVNDRILKWRFHNTATGKLSDVAGLIVAPAVLVAAVELGAWILRRPVSDRRRRTIAAMACGLTAAFFAAVQFDNAATDLYRDLAGLWWGRPALVVADPTDLLTLPAALIPLALVVWEARHRTI